MLRFPLLTLLVLVALAAALLPSSIVPDAHAGKLTKRALPSLPGCTAKWSKKNQRTRDVDRDRVPNIIDKDIDGDRRANGRDVDVDGDRRANVRDRDVDADAIPNRADRDIDSDRRLNQVDRDIDGDRQANKSDLDMDGDKLPNRTDPDIDGDCVPNASDPDMDGDGIPNVSDDNADGSGPARATADATAPTRVAPQFFGVVNEHAMAATGPDRDALLDQVVASGTRTIRQTFDWKEIERSPGIYNWGWYDEWMKAVSARGLTVLPILFNPPSFRSSAPGDPERGIYPPRSNGEFAEFAAQAARRYGPNGSFWAERPDLPARPVRAWQVWNEPNIKFYWPDGADPAAYVSMLRTVGATIKSVDPGAEIVTAGVPQSPGDGHMPLAEFVTGMYNAGAKGAFDTLAVHPYASSADGSLGLVDTVRKLMDANGDASSSIWVTEIGWSDTGPASPYTVGEAGQSEMIRRLFTALAAQRDRLRLKGVVYYAWRDAPPYGGRQDFWGLHTGLYAIDGSPKPALQTYVATLRSLSDTSAAR